MPYKDPHSEKAKARDRRFRLKNRERINAKDRERRKNDPEYRKKRLEHVKKYVRENREKVLAYKKRHNLEKLYNIKWDKYLELLKKQNEKCAVCGEINKSTRKLAVDHNHKTGKIRGLLCDKCNLGMGYMRENISLLQKLIIYIKKYE